MTLEKLDQCKDKIEKNALEIEIDNQCIEHISIGPDGKETGLSSGKFSRFQLR